MGFLDNYKRIMVFIHDNDKKSFPKIVVEFFKLWLIKQRFPLHYFGRFLYRKEFTSPENFMDMKEYRSFIYANKNSEEQHVNLLSNKFLFSLICEKYSLPSPKMVSYNLKKSFFLDDQIIEVKNVTDLKNYFRLVFSKSKHEKIFLKSFCGYGGKEVFLLEYSNLENHLNHFGDIILNDSFIHQQPIIQHKEINKIYPHSVNTLRVETYISADGSTNILGAFMRFGTGGSNIDNVSSGGFFVPIDIENGVLLQKGMQAMIYGGAQVTEHPDTNFLFTGYRIPYFDEALDLCLKFCLYIPNRLAGWDVAITPDGPIMVEGNHTPGITVGEIGYGGYVKHPLYKDMMSNLD